MLTDFLRQQFAAYASIPVSTARLLAALADAAEASVGVLQQIDERATATNRVLHSFEGPLVRLADAVDASFVDQTVEALARLPAVLTRASTLAERADGLMTGLEAPVRALGPLTQALDVGRIGGLVERIEESLPGLVRLPDAEHEVRRLRETLDRMYRVVDEVQGRFGAFPGAALLRQRDTDPGTAAPAPPAASGPAKKSAAKSASKAQGVRGRGRTRDAD
ncbi:MAG TPA: hypothetical protein VLR26_17485 [Frankiaceae bacterium]|nr:hypothetical protein [Frankiaceae bacterium]